MCCLCFEYCWCSLRCASYASALYTLVYFLVTIILVEMCGEPPFEGPCVEPWTLNDTLTAVVAEDALFSSVTSDELTLMILNKTVLTVSSVGVVCCLLLIYGLWTDTRLLLPWLVVVGCASVVDVTYNVFLMTESDTTTTNPLIDAGLFTADFVLIFFNVSSILCVATQFRLYKQDERHQHLSHRHQRHPLQQAVLDAGLGETPTLVELRLAEFDVATGASVATGRSVVGVESKRPSKRVTFDAPPPGDAAAAAAADVEAAATPPLIDDTPNGVFPVSSHAI